MGCSSFFFFFFVGAGVVIDAGGVKMGMFGPGQSHSRTPTPRQDERTNGQIEVGGENQQQVVQRSRWQAVLLEAGGIGAAVSEESMRRLKYCLQWLQVCPGFLFISWRSLECFSF